MPIVSITLGERLADAHAAGEHWVATEGLVATAERHELRHWAPESTHRLRLAHGRAHAALGRFCDAVRRAEHSGLAAAESNSLMLAYQERVGWDHAALGCDQAPGFSFKEGRNP